MATTTLIDIRQPSINVLHDTTQGHTEACIILSVKTFPDNNEVMMHFDNKEDYQAFKGLLNMAGD